MFYATTPNMASVSRAGTHDTRGLQGGGRRDDTLHPARIAGRGSGIKLDACAGAPFFAALFLYSPKPEVQKGKWRVPPINSA